LAISKKSVKSFVEFLNANAGVINLVFAGVVAISTLVYALLTRQLVKETQLMRMVQTEPKIEVTIRLPEYAIHIARIQVRNIGLGPALNVQFSLSVVSGGEMGQKLLGDFTKPDFFRTGLAHLGPAQERRSHFTEMNKDHEAKTATVLAVNVTYRSVTGRDYEEAHILDLSEFRGTSQVGKPDLYAIAQSLESLRRDFGHVVSGFKRVHADVYTAEDRAGERAAQERELEMLRASQSSSAETRSEK
jgi:hypothetical protein